MDSETQARIARNEARFREANRQIEQAVESAEIEPDEVLQLLCECAELSCTTMIPAGLAELREVRRRAEQFLVAPGHVADGAERVVRRASDYWVVAKTGVAGMVARSVDSEA